MKKNFFGRLIPVILLVAAILLVIAGIFREEAECVVEKATKICMECIGIG